MLKENAFYLFLYWVKLSQQNDGSLWTFGSLWPKAAQGLKQCMADPPVFLNHTWVHGQCHNTFTASWSTWSTTDMVYVPLSRMSHTGSGMTRKGHVSEIRDEPPVIHHFIIPHRRYGPNNPSHAWALRDICVTLSWMKYANETKITPALSVADNNFPPWSQKPFRQSHKGSPSLFERAKGLTISMWLQQPTHLRGYSGSPSSHTSF